MKIKDPFLSPCIPWPESPTHTHILVGNYLDKRIFLFAFGFSEWSKFISGIDVISTSEMIVVAVYREIKWPIYSEKSLRVNNLKHDQWLSL